jgi:hypothetical protein
MALGKWHSLFGTSKGRGHGRLSRKVKLENAEGREKSLQASLVYGAAGEEKSKHRPHSPRTGTQNRLRNYSRATRLLELLDEFLDIERESLVDLTNGKLIHREGCGKIEYGIGEFAVVQPGREQPYRSGQQLQHGNAIPDCFNLCSGAASALIEADAQGGRLIWSAIWGIALNIALHLPDVPKIGRIDNGHRALTGEPRKRIHSGKPFPHGGRRAANVPILYVIR